MTSLQDLTSEADKAKRTLTLGTPQTDDALAIMEATEGVLEDLKNECYINIGATTEVVQFERIRRIVVTVRDVIKELIGIFGDLNRDFGPIAEGRKLLDALDLHIRISRNASSLEANSRPAQDALNALDLSIDKVRNRIVSFQSSATDLFTRYREKNH
jgi:hypothetical protein